MLIANELRQRVSMDDTNVHASVISGKVRISSFTITAESADTELTIAFLPAGRGRALPVLCRFETKGITGNIKIGTGAYTSSTPGVGRVAAVDNNMCGTIVAADDTPKSFSGAIEGVPYNSLEDIPVILTGTIPKNAVIKGLFVYNVT